MDAPCAVASCSGDQSAALRAGVDRAGQPSGDAPSDGRKPSGRSRRTPVAEATTRLSRTSTSLPKMSSAVSPSLRTSSDTRRARRSPRARSAGRCDRPPLLGRRCIPREERDPAERVGLDGQGVAAHQHGRRPAAGRVRLGQRGPDAVEVAARHLDHHGGTGLVPARGRPVALADGEGVHREDRQRARDGDDDDDGASLGAAAGLEQARAGDEPTPAQQAAPERTPGRSGEVGEQEAGEQRRAAPVRPARGDPGGCRWRTRPRRCRRRRPRRPRPPRAPTARTRPGRCAPRRAGARGPCGPRRRASSARWRPARGAAAVAKPGAGLERRRRPAAGALTTAPPARATSAPGRTPDEEGGEELEQQQGRRPGRAATAQPRHGDLARVARRSPQ